MCDGLEAIIADYDFSKSTCLGYCDAYKYNIGGVFPLLGYLPIFWVLHSYFLPDINSFHNLPYKPEWGDNYQQFKEKQEETYVQWQ